MGDRADCCSNEFVQTIFLSMQDSFVPKRAEDIKLNVSNDPLPIVSKVSYLFCVVA